MSLLFLEDREAVRAVRGRPVVADHVPEATSSVERGQPVAVERLDLHRPPELGVTADVNVHAPGINRAAIALGKRALTEPFPSNSNSVMQFCPRSRDRRSKSRDRSRSRHRSEKKKKSHREKKEVKYSVSRSRSKSPVRKASREPSREKASAGSSKRRSPERKLKKISEEHTRDYDAEEKIGMDDNGCEKSSSKSDNMDISP